MADRQCCGCLETPKIHWEDQVRSEQLEQSYIAWASYQCLQCQALNLQPVVIIYRADYQIVLLLEKEQIVRLGGLNKASTLHQLHRLVIEPLRQTHLLDWSLPEWENYSFEVQFVKPTQLNFAWNTYRMKGFKANTSDDWIISSKLREIISERLVNSPWIASSWKQSKSGKYAFDFTTHFAIVLACLLIW
jgi:hypothetical protein